MGGGEEALAGLLTGCPAHRAPADLRSTAAAVIALAVVLLVAPTEAGAGDPRWAPGWVLDGLDIARDAAYLAELEKDVVLEMNMVRADPARYGAEFIGPRLRFFDGIVYGVPGEEMLVTREGPAAVKECLDALGRAGSLPPLLPSGAMSRAAREHADAQGATGGTGHDGADGSTFRTRLERHGDWSGAIGENIDYGHSTAREVVISLLLDDGVPSREHRKNLLNPRFTVTGLACGAHARYGAMCVIDLAGGYREGGVPAIER